MSETRYCYHCGTYHPESVMRQIETKNGKRYRCIASLEVVKKPQAERDAFGRRVTEDNRREASKKQQNFQRLGR